MPKAKNLFLLSLMTLLCVSTADATFIKCEIKNPASVRATGFQVLFLSKGKMQNAKLDGVGPQVRLVKSNLNQFDWRFDRGISPEEKLTVRLEFTPDQYWENIFDNRFSYAEGKQQRGIIPYAGFFIYFTPTSNPNKVLATLTIRKNSQGIDDPNIPIVFKNSQVYVDNDLRNYTIDKFDRPTGRKLELPDSFTLGPGEERNFNLGLVNAAGYIFTRSTVSYGESKDKPKDKPKEESKDKPKEEHDMECAHSYVEQVSKDKMARLIIK
jgi:hypothetical protein